MEGLPAELVAWLTHSANWSGPNGVPTRLLEHVQLSGLSVLVAMAVALPLGLFIGHTARFTLLVVSIANIGRALPSFALLVMALPVVLALGLGLGFWPTFVPLVLLAIPPILTNTYVGVRGVDQDLVEAARGMGMRDSQVVLRVELPSALPIIFAGLRIAAVQVVATATLGAVVASGGLGRYIVDGLAQQDVPRLVVGAVLVALLAVGTERALSLLERRVVSAGIRAPSTREVAVAGGTDPTPSGATALPP
ncbi:MAG: ABC transporter permease [Chloroflexi bacterium]|nr:ABC transporter permease [Chloroflexota bacterium]